MTTGATREEMLAYLVAFGKLVPEYYERLEDETLKREYEDCMKA